MSVFFTPVQLKALVVTVENPFFDWFPYEKRKFSKYLFPSYPDFPQVFFGLPARLFLRFS
jgi:hypothetical protein